MDTLVMALYNPAILCTLNTRGLYEGQCNTSLCTQILSTPSRFKHTDASNIHNQYFNYSYSHPIKTR